MTIKATHFDTALHPLRSIDLTEHAEAAGILQGEETTIDLRGAIDFYDLTDEQLNEAMSANE